MLTEKGLVFPLPPDADANYYCYVLQERGAYIKQLKAGTLSFKEVYAAYPKLFQRKASNAEIEGLAQIIAETEDLTSPEQLKWLEKTTLYENGQLVTMGTLRINWAMQAMPTNPAYKGDIPQYDGTSQLAITDTVTDKALQFIAVKIDGKQLLVCDRNVVANISWDQLNSQSLIDGEDVTIDDQKYKLRVLTGGTKKGDPCEWDKMMAAVGTDNAIWHWDNMYSWCKEETDGLYRALRGASAASWNKSHSNYTGTGYGWRPVLEIL